MDLKYTSKMKRIIERGTIFEDEYKKGKKSGYGILIWNKMVTNIQAYFKMINLMVLEYIILQMDLFMKING
ncbi:unnamed protein product [Paramecium sonneborni]|uniref:Uncharacterized protein n=1 Tax=Paramecium sonneborni TaxID=65129 RepID=A0A8S1M6K9_9CILI|nr:unnamed protein product [Paramecium sonneborni]